MSYLSELGLAKSNYDKFPAVEIPTGNSTVAWQNWADICAQLKTAITNTGTSTTLVAIDTYPGVNESEIAAALQKHLPAHTLIDTREAFLSEKQIDSLIAPFLGGDDPIFGYLTNLDLPQFLDPAKTKSLQQTLSSETTCAAKAAPQESLLASRYSLVATPKITILLGPAAFLIAPNAHIRIYADMPRWEGQLRQRRGEVTNLGASNKGEKASRQYKRAFFIDWRVCDRHKRATIATWHYYLDTANADNPRLLTAPALLDGLRLAATRPIRLVPFFDPGPWGGQWMRQVCDLPDGPPNYAWCFDCVPEENSLLLSYHGITVETPANNLVHNRPTELLGEAVRGLFGAEFPIRFDFLDTMQGGNLSFQVHPDVGYVQHNFNLRYTQDESYYLLDSRPDGIVYLGRKDGTTPDELIADLQAAQDGKKLFDHEKFAAAFPAKKHDHFLIPSGTLHCSAANTMVLEISATPYIFTFKLWDWNRLGLDGKPRPINLERGKKVIRWERDQTWCAKNLVNQFHPVSSGDGWREEHTGLYRSEFIETRRHWFTKKTPHARTNSVDVLNLVQGTAAIVESPTNAFAPFEVHYAETFILPHAAGTYTIRPKLEGEECATLKAYIRTNP